MNKYRIIFGSLEYKCYICIEFKTNILYENTFRQKFNDN